MAYSELIKNFSKIREYMRDFYVYGFRTRSAFDQKSARSYDNERRRIESWLGEYMSFRQDREGRHVFLSVDSRSVPFNPLYQAYKSKSFTANDITFHFLIMDILADGPALTATQILAQMTERLDEMPGTGFFPDESTLRKKLKEYTSLGLLERTRQGREAFYRRKDSPVDPDSWADALCFASETDLVGVIGSFLLDRIRNDGSPSLLYAPVLRFKHHYLLNAFDQEILWQLMEGRRQKRIMEITLTPRRGKKTEEGSEEGSDPVTAVTAVKPRGEITCHVYPLRFCCSTQNGRRYLLAHAYGGRGLSFFRLDRILKVRLFEKETSPEVLEASAEKALPHIWGVSVGTNAAGQMDHVELKIHIDDHETFVKERLLREKRCGNVQELDEHTLLFSADVYDALEMLPWIRTFTGRILSFSCSSAKVEERFWEDLKTLQEIYDAFS